MNWVVENWIWIVVAVSVAVVILGPIVYVLLRELPDAEVKDWSVQESVFYGFCILAIATLFS